MQFASLDSIKVCREDGFFAVLRARVHKDDARDNSNRLCAIKVTGSDAASFLHSQLTNEVKALQPGDGNLSARVRRTGTLVSYFSLHRMLDESPTFLLVIEGEHAEKETTSLLADLQKFAVVEDVELEDVSAQFDWITIQSPKATQICEEIFGKVIANTPEPRSWIELKEYDVRHFQSGPPPGSFVLARSLTGDPGFIIAIPREAEMLNEILDRITEKLGPKFRILVGELLDDVLDVLRIEAGVVRMGLDAEEGKLVLPETGLEQQVVSYSKGCYLGQEVIARIRTYGSVPLVLRGLMLPADTVALNNDYTDYLMSLNARLSESNSDLFLEDGTKIGRITSRTYSPVFEAPIAFAFLDRAHRTPGTKLKIRGQDGSILEAEVRLRSVGWSMCSR